MWDMNKSYAILIATLVFLVGCATSKEPLVDGRQASPLLNESQALQIGIDYAKEKGLGCSACLEGCYIQKRDRRVANIF
jgi:hypothetical protein